MEQDGQGVVFFWNTFVPGEGVWNRWQEFTRTEQLAMAGCLRLVIMTYPERVEALNPDMRNALKSLCNELDDLVRS